MNTSGHHVCGYSGKIKSWRLPTIEELASLLNSAEADPADYLNLQGMIGVQKSRYWTDTTAGTVLNAWVVDFATAGILTAGKIDRNFILPVLGPAQMRNPAGSGQEEGEEGEEADGDDAGAGAAAPPARFIVENGTVTDLETGLMWLQDISCLPRKTWPDALEFINGVASGGEALSCRNYTGSYGDWALPNIIELRSLIDFARDFPALREDAEFAGESAPFWSSTTYPAAPARAFLLDADTGGVTGADKSEKHHFILVRKLDTVLAAPRIEPEEAIGVTVAEDQLLAVSNDLKSEIKSNLKDLLGVKEDHINIKAKTNEDFGSVGRGKSVAALATVLLRGK